MPGATGGGPFVPSVCPTAPLLVPPRLSTAIALLAAVALLAPGCARSARGDEAGGDAVAGRPAQESWDAVLRVTRDGADRAQIAAPYLARYEGADSTYALLQADPARPDPSGARAVHVRLFDDAGAPSATVDADRLVYRDDEQRFVAEGRVVVVTDEGRRLESEQVRWDEGSRELRAAGFVRITAPDERFEGYGLVAAEDLSTYELARVTGQAEVEDWE